MSDPWDWNDREEARARQTAHDENVLEDLEWAWMAGIPLSEFAGDEELKRELAFDEAADKQGEP